jgi:predicted outer membrane repeat protein
MRLITLRICTTLALVGAAQWGAAQAATIVVNSTADSGAACTLRNAMQNANNNSQTNSACAAGTGTDTITFDPTVFATPQTITVGSTLPQLTDSNTTTIDGGNMVTINGQNSVQILWVGDLGSGTGSAVLRNLVVANGNADTSYGGGVFMTGTSLELDHVTFSGNTATYGGGGFFTQNGTTTIYGCLFTGNTDPNGGGGGIENSGQIVNIFNSTFTGNTAGSGGSAIFTAYGGTMTVTNSTFNNNSASYYGSAIRNFSGTALTLDYVTISGNPDSNHDGALDTEQDATTSVKNSIIAGNTGYDCNIADPANFTDQGNNFFGDFTCGRAGDGNPQLNALGYNGGSTPTMVPQAGSPALGAASCDTVATDQRGVARPQNGKCDIGAVEIELSLFANGFEPIPI